MFSYVVRAGSGLITWIAIQDALYAAWMAISNHPSPSSMFLIVFVSGGIITLLAKLFIRKKVNAQNFDGDERDYMCAAWLCAGFGVVLILVEGLFEVPRVLGWKTYEVQFVFEDLLLGLGALCALAEEVRLFRRSIGK